MIKPFYNLTIISGYNILTLLLFIYTITFNLIFYFGYIIAFTQICNQCVYKTSIPQFYENGYLSLTLILYVFTIIYFYIIVSLYMISIA